VRGKIQWSEKAQKRRSLNTSGGGNGGSNSGGFDGAPAVSCRQEVRGGGGVSLECNLRWEERCREEIFDAVATTGFYGPSRRSGAVVGAQASGGCGLEGAQPLGGTAWQLDRCVAPVAHGSPLRPTWIVARIRI
jgi:hypothetical protein